MNINIELFYTSSELIGNPTSGASVAAADLLAGLTKLGVKTLPSDACMDAASMQDQATSFIESRCSDTECRVIMGFGSDDFTQNLFNKAKQKKIVTVLHIHNFHYRKIVNIKNIDYIVVPSTFAADYYREALGLDCLVLPSFVNPDRVLSPQRDPRFVTFINPTYTKGVYILAKIIDELGTIRPDIRFLVVESRGTEATLAQCGLDLTRHKTVSLMSNTADPREFWALTKVCLMPSLWMESEGLVAVEAMMNGVPVIASGRGALPSTLGDSGLVLNLPENYTAATRELPTAEEVKPWVDAIIRLWDDQPFYEIMSAKSRHESGRWSFSSLSSIYGKFLTNLQPLMDLPLTPPLRRAEFVVLVPHLNGIDSDCEQSLLELERQGIRVIRRSGSSQIDLVRNEMASSALREGYKAILFIDADIGFDPIDAIRLLMRPERVIAGIYVKKNHREFASRFHSNIQEVSFGAIASGYYPLDFAATGFLKLDADCLKEMIDKLNLPLCNTQWGEGYWPFFQPLVVPVEGGYHYLGEDWAFSHRLKSLGITILADTSFRLWHFGRYGFSWEDAGIEARRYVGFNFKL